MIQFTANHADIFGELLENVTRHASLNTSRKKIFKSGYFLMNPETTKISEKYGKSGQVGTSTLIL